MVFQILKLQKTVKGFTNEVVWGEMFAKNCKDNHGQIFEGNFRLNVKQCNTREI